MEFDGRRYGCKGFYSEWSSCTFSTRDPPRKDEPIKLPDSVQNSQVSDVIFSYFLPFVSSLYMYSFVVTCHLRICYDLHVCDVVAEEIPGPK